MAAPVKRTKNTRTGQIGAIDKGGIKECGIGIYLFPNVIDRGRTRTAEIEELISPTGRIEYRIALRHRDVELFRWIPDSAKHHVVVDDIAPVPDKTRDVDAVRDGIRLCTYEVANLPCTEAIRTSWGPHAVTVANG